VTKAEQILAAARHREVARRYARSKTLASIRRAELMRLYRHRFPGLSEVRLTKEIDDALQCAPMDLTPTEAGTRVKLTLVERFKLGIRTIAAYDASAAEVKAFYRDRKRERDREAAKRRRSRQRKGVVMSKADLQRRRLWSVLRSKSEADPQHWSTVRELADAVAKSKAFAGLTRKSVHNAINRSLDGLADIEQDTVLGKNSFPTRIVRWKGFRATTQLGADTKKMVPTTKNVASRSGPL
jgi:hypothetical protein